MREDFRVPSFIIESEGFELTIYLLIFKNFSFSYLYIKFVFFFESILNTVDQK